MDIAGKESKSIVVNLGEVAVAIDDSVVLTCLGLGSCVAICVYDPISRVGGMAHVVLPNSNGSGNNSSKYANVAVPTLLDKMYQKGALKNRINAKITGGAQMVTKVAVGENIGEKNTIAVKTLLSEYHIKLTGEEVGGNRGRSVWLHVNQGKVLVRQIGTDPHEL